MQRDEPARAAPEAAPTGPREDIARAWASLGQRQSAMDASRAPEAAASSPLWRFLMGFVYAGRGLLYAIRTQRNVRVHAVVGAVAIALGIALRLSAVEFALVFVAITGVFIAEMFNTVIEACVDLITDAYHPLARIAKDVAAGAVLLSAILSVVIALFVYVPHLWPLLARWLGR